ncbi:hypothetical protein Tco_0187210 [Tanacetum coccineum]
MGSHPSWIWSSLLHGRDLLLQGVRWQVGKLVSDFILNAEWNLNKLHEKVSKEEVDFIMQIPISKASSPDRLVWHFDAKGRYIVKSGYEQAILKRNTLSSKEEESTTNPSAFFLEKSMENPSTTESEAISMEGHYEFCSNNGEFI